ncbi:MAG: cupin domain-containing protein [Eubacteriales bacterium]
MNIIRREDIDSALEKEYRQYLTGHLKKAQLFLNHIDDDIEIGISYYSQYTPDKPHFHPICTEHGYVLEGAVKLRLLDGSNEEYIFTAGDFFVLRPGVPYATKNIAGTRILFIKSPGTDDKQLVGVDDDLKKWLAAWEE